MMVFRQWVRPPCCAFSGGNGADSLMEDSVPPDDCMAIRDGMQLRIVSDTVCGHQDFFFLFSRSKSQVARSGTGRPVAPFVVPVFQAVPAMSRCAQV